MDNQQIKIDVVSDIVCPWCYIGKRRLEQALETTGEAYPVTIAFHPFQLDPGVPAQGAPFVAYMNRRFGGDALRKFEQVEKAGRSAGLDFRFAEIPKAINTFDLHRLLHLARENGNQYAVKEALMQAYFLDRKDLSEPDTIAEVMAPLGWTHDQTREVLASDRAAAEVRAAMQGYQQMGVRGVPFFILQDKYGLSGAQPPEVFVSAIRQVAEEMGLAPAPTGQACGAEGKDC